jgi:hypothetical protein
MSDHPSVSIEETVDALFSACCIRYGTEYFLARWAGQKLSAVKRDWCRVLEGLERNQRAVRYALANLPDKPPMAHEIKTLAANAPAPRDPCLSWEPKPDPKRVAAVREQLARLRGGPKPPEDPKALAQGLLEREARGEKLSLAQRDYMRRVLAPDKALPAAPGNERTPA